MTPCYIAHFLCLYCHVIIPFSLSRVIHHLRPRVILFERSMNLSYIDNYCILEFGQSSLLGVVKSFHAWDVGFEPHPRGKL